MPPQTHGVKHLKSRAYIPATGWCALIKSDKKLLKIPLVCFEVVHEDGEPTVAIGLAFTTVKEKNLTFFSSAVKSLEEDKNFTGYLAPGETIEEFIENREALVSHSDRVSPSSLFTVVYDLSEES